MSYIGVAFHSKYPDGKKSGELSFSSNSLIFKNETDTVSFGLESLQIESGGASNALIYFKHPKFPDWVIYTSDRGIIKESAFQEHSHLKEFVKKSRVSKGLLYALFVFLIGIPVLLIVALFSFRSGIVKYIANKVPVKYEQEMGDKMFPMAIQGKDLIQDSAMIAQLQKVTKPLQLAVNDTNFKFTFYIIEDSELNAFALPGGHVVIHSGLIQNSDSYEELAGVLAHELSHVTLRHHIRGVINNLGLMAILGGFIGGDDGFYSSILYGGAQLSLLKYSRDMETEADEQGFKYLQKSKIDPGGMITFFKKLQKKYEKDHMSEEVEDAMSFVNTHPATKERIANLEAMLRSAKLKDSKPIEGDYELLKNSVDGKLKNK